MSQVHLLKRFFVQSKHQPAHAFEADMLSGVAGDDAREGRVGEVNVAVGMMHCRRARSGGLGSDESSWHWQKAESSPPRIHSGARRPHRPGMAGAMPGALGSTGRRPIGWPSQEGWPPLIENGIVMDSPYGRIPRGRPCEPGMWP